ncbi:glycoside hydrolase family 61 protein [Paraphaeosphaeria minitans]|uniref:AA9 family lytic polysaccharide monooxygenase n=1 Tax=Paraphaeosphaeria minitans TaxID=565426 RepID=A0A9P6GSM5_9PLEO|nr:glycoside hydrolase family 61 protein [Paraphaeosphaeria minitans]
MRLIVAISLAALSGSSLAHGGVTSYLIDNKNYTGEASYVWYDAYESQHELIQRSWHMNPLSDPASTNLTCNNKGLAVPGAFHASVTAGSTIRATWVTPDGYGWPHTLGPMVAYMVSCGEDCTTITDTSSLKWFKIAEEGLRAGYAVGEDDGWYQNDLWENRRTEYWNVTVPAGLKSGRYLIRHEIIMLELNPVQFYPNCAHLEVRGEGASVPSDEFLVTFPGAYSLSDPGIAISGKVRSDKTTKNYIVPGPKVWKGE